MPDTEIICLYLNHKFKRSDSTLSKHMDVTEYLLMCSRSTNEKTCL